MLEIEIRGANLTDLEFIYQLDRLVFGNEGYSYIVLRQLYDACGDFLYVATSPEDEIIGYTIGCPKIGGVDAWVLALAVSPTWGHKGIAKQLSNILLSQLSNVGIANVWLTVSPKNNIAIHLYNSIGFEFITNDANYFGKGISRDVMRKKFVNKSMSNPSLQNYKSPNVTIKK